MKGKKTVVVRWKRGRRKTQARTNCKQTLQIENTIGD